MKLQTALPLYLLLATAPLAATQAETAQEAVDEERLAPGETVKDRAHPEYDALGIRSGSFTLYPQVKLTAEYDDNIYYANGNETEDWVTTLSPSLRIASDWSRHALQFDLGADLVRYDDYSDEDGERYWLEGTARIDVSRATQVRLKAGVRADMESRGSPDDANGLAPADTRVDSFEASFEHRPNRIFVKGRAALDRRDFDDVVTSLGTVINNDDRDRDQRLASLTVGYEITPQFDAFVRYTHEERDYEAALDDGGFNRDSSGDTLVVGTDLDISKVLLGEVAVGALSRDYDDPTFRDVDEASAKALLYWHVTPLTTVTFQLERSVAETTTAASSGYISDVAAVNVYHELLRNLVLEASLSSVTNDYEAIGREDDITTFRLSGEYEMNRRVFFGAGYEYGERESNNVGVDYDRSVLSAWVGLRI